jgi:hypothetical protein
MGGKKNIPGRKDQQGTIITLVAVFMLFVVGAMAALSIDAVTIYTARSEAQLAADSAALAAARVIANSGATSDSSGALLAIVETNPGGLAQTVAIQVAQSSMVGGRYLIAANGEVVVSFGGSPTNLCLSVTDPCVTVRVQRTDLPTFFARIWGNSQVTVAASATAEAYNPSNPPATFTSSSPAVAPLCVKPWLLPNLDPTSTTQGTIFDPTGTGKITNASLLGWSSITAAPAPMPMTPACAGPGGDCSGGPLPGPTPWAYYPGDPGATSFPSPPTEAWPTCSMAPTLTPYQASIAGCIQTPISCNNQVNIDMNSYTTRNSETADAVNCLTHDTVSGGGDTVALNTVPASAPFQFLAGNDNPVTGSGTAVMVSDSLVAVPVFDNVRSFNTSGTNFQIVGFVQLFLNPDSTPAPDTGTTSGYVNTTIINLAGCRAVASGQPVLGNGASPVAVRLISGK